LDDLTLRIPIGCVYGFIGPSGAGKSTTIRMLMGVLRKSGGKVSVLGFDPSERREAMRQQIGYVPELHFIYRWMRVCDVIGFCRSLYATWNDRVCADLMKMFELDEKKKVKELSKGMVAKLSLIVAIAHEPELLILDEPTSGLDPLVREEFLDGVLRMICERQKTVLFSSHTLGDVQRLADRVGIIHDGHLLADCPTDELLRMSIGAGRRRMPSASPGSTSIAPGVNRAALLKPVTTRRVSCENWLLVCAEREIRTPARG
jgi:ABC-2 type transport system ATP-binding protein